MGPESFSNQQKDWPRHISLVGEQFGRETQPRNKALGINWAWTVQFEMKCSLERKHNDKK